MKEYIWLKPHYRYSYSKGNVCKLAKEAAERLIKDGHVKLFKRPVAAKKQKATK